MAPHEKRPSHPGPGAPRQPQAGLVAMQKRARVAGRGQVPDSRQRLSGVQQPGNCPWGERSGCHPPGAGRPMAPHEERVADAPGSDGWEPPKGMVEMLSGA